MDSLKICVVGSVRSGTNWIAHLFSPIVDEVIADADYNGATCNERYRNIDNRDELLGKESFVFKQNEDLMNMENLDKMIELFPDIKFILVIRDPIKIVESICKAYPDSIPMRFFPAVSKIQDDLGISRVEASTIFASGYINQIPKFINKYSDRAIIVKYEDLVYNFEDTLSGLYNYFGHEISQKQIDEVERPIGEHGEGLTPDEVSIILDNTVIREALDKYGYFIGGRTTEPTVEPTIKPDENDNIAVSDYIARNSKTYYSKGSSGFRDKFAYVRDFVDGCGKILDAGSGSGNYARELISSGKEVFCIDHSKYCCDNFLIDIPHENKSIVEFCGKTRRKFDCVYCIDVLEHIPYDDICDNLKALSRVSNKFLFGIANHPDVQFGYQLHKIIEGRDWWIENLSEYFDNVEHIASLFLGQFFFIKCEN